MLVVFLLPEIGRTLVSEDRRQKPFLWTASPQSILVKVARPASAPAGLSSLRAARVRA